MNVQSEENTKKMHVTLEFIYIYLSVFFCCLLLCLLLCIQYYYLIFYYFYIILTVFPMTIDSFFILVAQVGH